MDAREPAYATMITNFDSTEQKNLWQELSEPLPEAMRDMSRLWCKNHTTRTCERIINDHPEFVTAFAGIIRTAYLYCPKIMISDAQLFDGVFFLALGPRVVNDIIGKSYKDGPAIIVSGREATLEDCLRGFTVSIIRDVKKDQRDGTERHQTQEGIASASDSDAWHTIRPLEYSAMGGIRIDHQDACGLSQADYQTFDDELRHIGVARAVANMMARVLRAKDHDHERRNGKDCSPTVEDRCRFLAERWQEWIDAEREGLVLYENQNDSLVQSRTQSEGFNHYLQQYGAAYAASIMEAWGFPPAVVDVYRATPSISSDPNETSRSTGVRNDEDDRWWAAWRQHEIERITPTDQNDTFAKLPADALAAGTRSEAFNRIDTTRLCGEQPTGLSRDAYRKKLRDWYQLSYQRALARHLGAQLVAVNAKENSVEQIVGCASRGASLMLAGNITQTLGNMPHVRFTAFCYETRSSIERWRICKSGGPRSGSGEDYVGCPMRRFVDSVADRIDDYRARWITRGIAYAVERAGEERSLAADARNLLCGTGIAIALAFFSAMADNVLFDDRTPLALLIVVAWLIDVIPVLLDGVGWLRSVRSSSKTVVYMT